ncbi:uncharacterized protein [Anoplolepis gracilipes]|uniref:uncharacterized protein n=1 Tax=Anoplolepis gracilipes TaxID=354296 RepID=UPI003B9F281F
MINNNDADDEREKIVREIAKTSESIRKKYHALKTGKIEEDVALERHFKPITELLKQIVENTIDVESDASKVESFGIPREEQESIKQKRSNISLTYEKISNGRRKRSNDSLTSTSNQSKRMKQSTPIKATTPETVVTSVQRQLQTSEGQNMLREHLGPLGQRYIGAILSQDVNNEMDYVYGVKFSDEGMMLGDKHFEVDKNDNIIINGVKYAGTPGLYELIFKRIPDDAVYTENDMHKYKSILLATNTHRRDSNVHNPVLGNKGYKYKYIIASLFPIKRKIGKGINLSRTVTLSENKIEYVHWNDPNKLVDRLRLLEASRQAGNNAHGNEIMSIIEELREAGLSIN